MTDTLDNSSLHSSAHPVLRAVALFVITSLLSAAVIGLVHLDFRLGLIRASSESSLVEIAQAVLLAGIAVVLFVAAARRPPLRAGLLLAAGFFLCLFIRENDGWLDRIHHGFWFPVALAAAAVVLLLAWRSRASLLPGFRALCESRTMPLLVGGLAMLLVFSRLFGAKALWTEAGLHQIAPVIKTVAEESLELLADAFLALWVALLVPRLPKG
ncbi:MAG: hypothetical protein IK066_01175 [Kiritimatiellae bacterium]|nr:hypothetical protein [Kiritimatiellia bacterium]